MDNQSAEWASCRLTHQYINSITKSSKDNQATLVTYYCSPQFLINILRPGGGEAVAARSCDNGKESSQSSEISVQLGQVCNLSS